MKKLLFCMFLTLTVATVGFGQNRKDKPQVADNNDTASGSSSGRGVVLNSGTHIEGQLQNSVDVKRAKVGDQVVLKTTKSVKQAGQTVVPKGSTLIGRVTDVQQKTKSNGTSKLGLVFDRLENKDMAMPINASITSITNVASSTHVGDSASSDLFGSSSTSTQSSGGSGLLGGVRNTAGGVLNTTTQTLGGVTNTAGQTLGTTTRMVGQTVNSIQISNSVNGSVQSGSTLSAANKNIRLDKGVTLQLTLNSSVHKQ